MLIRSGEALGVSWSRNMLYSGFYILPRSVFRRQNGFAARITRTLSRLNMTQRQCDSCGQLLPPVNDAFCSYCHAPIGEQNDRKPAWSFEESIKEHLGNANQHHTTPKPPTKIYKAPRKFDLSMIFVVTFAYAGAFGLMQTLRWPLALQVGVMSLLTIVGFIQMFAPERRVRTASVLTGILFMAAMFYVSLAIDGNRRLTDIVLGTLCTVIGFGSLLGYCSGVLVSSIFMLTDYVRRFFARNNNP